MTQSVRSETWGRVGAPEWQRHSRRSLKHARRAAETRPPGVGRGGDLECSLLMLETSSHGY